MEEVARRARIGVGTLYRRFPDRDAPARRGSWSHLGAARREARPGRCASSTTKGIGPS
ncbi:TetR family transcriptional regulator [Nannocystis exedens]|uniref:TetR family transcriptional regulator n=1 Tax=Nannocystis exedens TaxID=54 RepID=UPI003B83A311